MRLVQIIPRGREAADGVGDLARCLAGALKSRHGVATRFLAGDEIPHEAEALTSALLAETQPDQGPVAVLVHYVGYGYARRGDPLWLIDGLAAWRSLAPDARLVALFHEVYASGPPWRSSFWRSPQQRRLAARLVGASEAVVTSLQLYRGLIRGLAPARDVDVLPVPSTVGEPDAVPPFRERAATLVVFGGHGGRERVYGPGRAALLEVCRRLSIEEILDIGPPAAGVPARLGGVAVRVHGVLAREAVSEALLRARVGIAIHAPAFLPKSTVHAAFCAHGVAPIALWSAPEAQELQAGVHYWTPALPTDALPDVASRAREWYGDHAIHVQVARYAELLAVQA